MVTKLAKPVIPFTRDDISVINKRYYDDTYEHNYLRDKDGLIIPSFIAWAHFNGYVLTDDSNIEAMVAEYLAFINGDINYCKRTLTVAPGVLDVIPSHMSMPRCFRFDIKSIPLLEEWQKSDVAKKDLNGNTIPPMSLWLDLTHPEVDITYVLENISYVMSQTICCEYVDYLNGDTDYSY